MNVCDAIERCCPGKIVSAKCRSQIKRRSSRAVERIEVALLGWLENAAGCTNSRRKGESAVAYQHNGPERRIHVEVTASDIDGVGRGEAWRGKSEDAYEHQQMHLLHGR